MTSKGIKLAFIFDSVRPKVKTTELEGRRWNSSLRVWTCSDVCKVHVHNDRCSSQLLVRNVGYLGTSNASMRLFLCWRTPVCVWPSRDLHVFACSLWEFVVHIVAALRFVSVWSSS